MSRDEPNRTMHLHMSAIGRPSGKAVLLLGAWISYALGFAVLYPRVGSFGAVLAIPPVLATYWSLGMGSGLVAGLLILPGNMLLMSLHPHTTGNMANAAGTLGATLLVLAGTIAGGTAGTLRASRQRMKDELARKEWVQATLKQQNTYLQTLNTLSRTLVSSLKTEEMLARALSLTLELLDATGGFIALTDADTGHLRVVTQVGMPKTWVGSVGDRCLEESPFERFHKTAGMTNLKAPDSETSGDVEALLKMGVSSAVGAPVVHDGESIGAVCVVNTSFDPPNGSAERVLTTIGQQLGMSIGKARLLEETAREREVAQSLLETAEILSTTLRFEELLERVLNQLQQIVPYDTASVFLLQDGYSQVAASRGSNSPARWQLSPLEEQPHIERVVRERRLLTLSEARDSRTGDSLDDVRALRSWLGVPLVAQDEVVGVLTMSSDSRTIDDEETSRRASAFAHQAGLAIENSRLYEQTRSQLRDVTILQEVTAAISSTLDVDQVLPYVAHSLCEILNGTSVEIFSLEENGRVAIAIANHVSARATRGERAFELGAKEPLDAFKRTPQALKRNRPMQIQLADPDLDPRAQAGLDDRGARAMLLLPIVTHDRALGFARVWDSGTARRFTRREIATGQTLAHQTAFAMENARLFEQTRTSLMETQALYRTSRSLIVQKRLKDVLQTVVDEVVEALSADRATVTTFDLEAGQVKSFVRGGPGSDHVVEASFPDLWNGLSGWVLRALRPALSVTGNPDPGAQGRTEVRRQQTNGGSMVVVPLIYRGRPLGTMTAINRPSQRDFTEKDVNLMMAFANQAAAALENARLIEETQRRASRLAGAADIARHATAITDQEQLLEVVVNLIREQFGFQLAGVFLIDETGRELYPAAATVDFWEGIPDAYRQPMGVGAIGKAAQSGKTVVIADADESDKTLPIEGWHPGCSISIPIQIGGVVLGVLEVEADVVHAFDENDQLALEIIADQIAIAYQNAELLSETRSRMTDLELLHDVSLAAASSSHLQETLQAAAEALAGEWPGTEIALQLIDEETGTLRMKASAGYAVDQASNLDLPLGEGITGWVAERGESVLAHDVSQDSRYYAANPLTRSELCVPLTAGGQVIGTLNVESPETNAFSLDDQRLLTTLASNLAILIERARLFEEIETARAELEQRAEALEGANVRLKELDRLKSQFLATMSHELRTPLNSVIGFSEVLIDGLLGEMPPEQEECVENIYASGEHLMALINDVLDLSKIEAGHMELAPQLVDVRKLIDNVEQTVKPMVEEKSQSLVVEIEEDLPPVTADLTRVRQVLLNLLSNAHKFTPAEGRITISCRLADSATMMFSVTDTGIGIKPEDQEIIFEEFRQANGTIGHEVEGTGLGLAISKRLVEMHGGSLWLESEYGEGTTFSFLFPLDGPQSTEDRANGEEAHPPVQAPVLLVESDRAFNNLLAVHLRRAGYDPVQRYDGAHLVEDARESNPLFIILEARLVGGDEGSIVQELESNPEIAGIPVVLVSMLREEETLTHITDDSAAGSLGRNGHRGLGSRLRMTVPASEAATVLSADDGLAPVLSLQEALADAGHALLPT